MISETVINWLLEPENPSVQYRTMIEILDKSKDDAEVQDCQSKIVTSTPVKVILDKMHPNGYWLQKNPRTGEILGEGLKYGAFGTTHYCLSYLAELGLDSSHPKVSKAAERYLSLQKTNGACMQRGPHAPQKNKIKKHFQKPQISNISNTHAGALIDMDF